MHDEISEEQNVFNFQTSIGKERMIQIKNPIEGKKR